MPGPSADSPGLPRALAYLWRHPRRTGFILFNLVALALFVAWGAFTANMRNEGLGGIPNVMLGYTGLAILVVLWLGAWLAWAYFVATRQINRRGI